MPQINKLVMEGFKSFQRKTAIPFFPGLTAVVGENGSGKTNILDALFFVMGKRSSDIRAEKVDHLIFNGGKGRKPADHALVTLHLDNQDGVFNDLVNGNHVKEITIGRKLTHSSSTYKFMGKNCSREMIDKVLKRASIDPFGYNFVKQNETTKIIKKTPKERREIIDKISGISSYEEKKERALRELETVDSNLAEKDIILSERKALLDKLEKERSVALKYKELENLKDRLDFAILKIRETSLKKEIEKNEKRISELKYNEKEVSKKIEGIDKELYLAEKKLETLEKNIEKNQEFSVFREIEGLKNQIFRRKSTIESKLNEIRTLEKSIEEINQLKNRYQGFGESKAVKALLNLGWEGIYGTVRDLIRFPERYSIAIETASSGHMSDIVLRNRELAIKCINYLKRNELGRVRILPLDKLFVRKKGLRAEKALHNPGVIDYAINLINFDPEYEKAIKYVFQDTLVSENLEAVKNVEGVRAVTLDGDLLSSGGAIVGGSRIIEKKRIGFDVSEKVSRIEKLKKEIEDLKREIGDLNELLEEKRKIGMEQGGSSKRLIEQRKLVSEKLDSLRKDRENTYERISQFKMELNKLEGNNERFRMELEEIGDHLKEFDRFNLKDIEEFMDSTVETLRYKRTSVLKNLNKLGMVNLRSIEDYENYKKEYDSFKEKVEKIKREKEEIEAIIDEVEEKKREKFMVTLKRLSNDFNKVFKILFGSGEAYLELEDPENIESGLIIKAHPPHKKPHVIDSLSGGEQVLTALAFIFAIQEQENSPFYILDEIDAALDATNSKRVAELLRNYAQRVQLIVVSHNEETVRYADRVYGVSMEQGVSKIRSIDLSKIENQKNNKIK